MRKVMDNQLSWFAILMTAFYSFLGSCRSEDCGPDQLQRCARPLQQIADTPTEYIKSKADLDKLCPELEDGQRCINRYIQRCMKDHQREHFYQLYEGTNTAIKELCQDGLYQERFLLYAPCMQKVKQDFDQCSANYTATMAEITFGNQPNQKKSICCSFQEYIACSYNTVLETCGTETAKFAKEFLDRMSNSLLKMHCQSYTQDVCRKSTTSTYSGVRNGGIVTSKIGSIILPFILLTASRYLF